MFSMIILSALCSTAVSMLIIYPLLVSGARDDKMVRVAISTRSQDLARLRQLAHVDPTIRNRANSRRS